MQMSSTPANENNRAGASINVDALVEYHRGMQSNADDCIEFGENIEQSEVVSFDKANPGLPDEITRHAEKTLIADEIETINHQGDGGTLQIDSPLLALVEEMDGEIKKPKQHHGLIIATIVLIILSGVVALVLVHIMNEEASPEAGLKQNAQPQAAVERRREHEYNVYPFDIDAPSPNILINGVPAQQINEPRSPDELPLIKGRNNMVSFYAKGRVPNSAILDKDRDVIENPLHYTMMHDDIFWHSKLIVKPPPNIDVNRAIYYVNGQVTAAQDEIVIDCVSGYPYFIQVHQDGFGDHLHVAWPRKKEETIQLPKLELESNAMRVTQFTLDIPKEYQQDPRRPLKLSILAEDNYTTEPGKRMIPKGELIEVSMSKPGRFPMQIILDSTPFGSITVDSYLQLSSIGASKVSFTRNSPDDITVCFRRTSEAICTKKNEVNLIPSGQWEIAAYREFEGEKKWLDNSPYETLKADTDYTFDIKSSGNRFDMSIRSGKK